MKVRQGLIIVFAFLTITSMSSCVKEYLCQCTITYSGQPGLPEPETIEYPIKDTKKNAQSVCEANSATAQNGATKSVEECKLY